MASERLSNEACGVRTVDPEPSRIPSMRLDHKRISLAGPIGRWIVKPSPDLATISSCERELLHSAKIKIAKLRIEVKDRCLFPVL